MDNMFRIWTPFIVIVVLSLYLYSAGGHRVYDVLMSGAAIIFTSPLIAALAIISKVKTGRVFEDEKGELLFSYPDNKLKKLPALFLIFIGRRKILPDRLKDLRLP